MAIAAAGILAAGAVAGGAMSASGSKSGASAQAAADEQAAQLAQQRYNTTQATLSPYVAAGDANLPAYSNFASGVTQPMVTSGLTALQGALPTNMTQAQLVNTPGYQFQLAAGQQAISNSQAARGLGVSGQALKQAAAWNSGLASTNYLQQFNIQQQQYQNQGTLFNSALAGNQQQYNQLGGVVGTGGECRRADRGHWRKLGEHPGGRNASGWRGVGRRFASGRQRVGQQRQQCGECLWPVHVARPNAERWQQFVRLTHRDRTRPRQALSLRMIPRPVVKQGV